MARILVVDDEVTVRLLLETALKRKGHKVLSAFIGVHALDILPDDGVCLVITDINMPYTKGLELIRHINTQMQAKIPVIVVTGITNEETRVHAMELGAQGYLTKPFDPRVMLDLVKSLS